MAKNYTVYVPAGNTLEMVTDALSSGYYQQLANPGSAPIAGVDLAASADVTIGPFNNARNYYIHLNTGDSLVTTQVASGVVTGSDDAALALKAPLASPTFTGVPILPTPFKIDSVSMTATGTELNYVVGVTSAIQSQLGTKAAKGATVITAVPTDGADYTAAPLAVTAINNLITALIASGVLAAS